MKSSLLTTLLLGCIFITNAQPSVDSSFAQNKKVAKNHKLAKMSKELSLNNEQKAKIASYNKDYSTKMKAIKSNTALAENDRKSQEESLKKERKEMMSQLLTAEQKQKAKQLKKKSKQAKDATSLLMKKNTSSSTIGYKEVVINEIKNIEQINSTKYASLNDHLTALNDVLDNYIAAVGVTLNTQELEELYSAIN
jgi:Spy/CpxP family protein refolding chaperone